MQSKSYFTKPNTARDNFTPKSSTSNSVSRRKPSAANALARQSRFQKRAALSATPPPSVIIKASTRGSREGGFLTEGKAAIYCVKITDQRMLASKRLAEQERRQAEDERWSVKWKIKRLSMRKAKEEERAMRQKRVDSIMSRDDHSDRFLRCSVANSESSNSLFGINDHQVHQCWRQSGYDRKRTEATSPCTHFT
ncbi:unnamed protein product [Mesocestoides corti]|uniref:Uncharacterized protein n=1 Tax=Mesocestoides corti TaxID=53468 RepID=A0A0R3UC07_MESCO|nr:unnamed protein product [Mesocestoides corti]